MAPVPLYADAFPERPALEEALSHALLDRAGLGALPEAMRLAVPGSLVSFGRLDALAPGFPAAVAAAREHGYAAVHRLVGGRAAVFNGTTVLFAHVAADPEPARGTHDRFRAMSGLVADALRALGVADPRVGEVPGEYCPGAFSVNAGGRLKLAGMSRPQIVAKRSATPSASSTPTEIALVLVGADREPEARRFEPVERFDGAGKEPGLDAQVLAVMGEKAVELVELRRGDLSPAAARPAHAAPGRRPRPVPARPRGTGRQTLAGRERRSGSR